MRKLLTEPLLHFILLGAGIFALYYLVQDENTARDEIIINDRDIAHISSLYEQKWNRAPTETELNELIKDQIRQEVFYREALRLNLDENDEVVKQRLAEKMEFLSNDLSVVADSSSDEALKTYFEKNEKKYLLPPALSFYQIVFTPERHSDNRKFAARTLQNLKNNDPKAYKLLGDPSPLPFKLENESVAKISVNLGKQMADTLQNIVMNEWRGPFKSDFGWHLVYLFEKTPAKPPQFSTVRDQVQTDFEEETRLKRKKKVYHDLLENYKVDIKADTLSTAQRDEIIQNLEEWK